MTPTNPPVAPTAIDLDGGGWLERLIFRRRGWIMALCAIITALATWQLPQLRLNANFDRMIPSGHPFIQHYKQNQAELAGQGNVLRIVVEHKQGSILDKGYLETLRKINDEVYLLGGVDRPSMVSLWTPTMRWLGVTEVGIDGDSVIDASYDGSPASLEKLRLNIERSGEIGRIVAADFRSSMVYVPLLDFDSETGGPIDYVSLSRKLDELRARYESDAVAIHVVGFAQLVGDLIAGLQQVLLFFGASVLLTTAMVYAYTRCLRSTTVVVACSLVAVWWVLGSLPSMGFELDPYSILVPFLIFAIGMSHGAQKMNGIMQDIGRGMPRLLAARLTFRRLFKAGLLALLCDVVGFAVLMLIDITVIRQLALIASLGVACLIFTNLILLPILLSYWGVDETAAARSARENGADTPLPTRGPWAFLARLTNPGPARVVGISALLLGALGGWLSQSLQIGDLDPGAPELRSNSRYNRDAAYITQQYAASGDVYIVMVSSPEGRCMDYPLQQGIDTLEWSLRQQPGVVSTDSFTAFNKGVTSQLSEGNPKWFALVPNQDLLNNLVKYAPRTLVNLPCSLSMLRVFLADHKAGTLKAVSAQVREFAAEHNNAEVQFLPAAGNAGIEAATNEVVEQANRKMLLWVYAVVIALCFMAFRSWRAVLCVVLPLMWTSTWVEALMVLLGIGVKVATLPVIALGVGIGVDYGLYVMSMVLARLRAGDTLHDAYARALQFTGKVVLLTGGTLGVSVAMWAFSTIKFQADMGVLLGFCFVANMLGALVQLPSLAAVLLRPTRSKPAAADVGDVPAASPASVLAPSKECL